MNLAETADVMITIYPVNDPPAAKNDAFTTLEDTPLKLTTQNLIGNDEDVDGDPLSITGVSSSNIGTVIKNQDGTFTYTPALNYFGSDSFTYTISDGVSTSQATVTIGINSVNDAPTANDDFYETGYGKKLVIKAPDVLSNDTDIENDFLSAVLVTSPLNGILLFNVDGSFAYVPDPDFLGVDTFIYSARDAQFNSIMATIHIDVKKYLSYLPVIHN